jgi:glycerophosphoryl diester phosphodiesterase
MQKLFPPPAIIAHRGASHDAPENTLASLRLARARGALWAEVDVKLTSDNIPILMHDATLDRTTSGSGLVAETDYATLKNYRIKSDFADTHEHIPTLTEALALAASIGLRLNLEIKPCAGRAEITARLALETVARCWPKNLPPLLISSFDRSCLAVAQKLQPAWPRGLISRTWPEDWRDIKAALDLSVLVINQETLTAAHIKTVHETGAGCVVYTINNRQKAAEFMALGVDAIVTDWPAELLATGL